MYCMYTGQKRFNFRLKPLRNLSVKKYGACEGRIGKKTIYQPERDFRSGCIDSVSVGRSLNGFPVFVFGNDFLDTLVGIKQVADRGIMI